MLKRALLLDIDGTLVDSNDAQVDAWQQALAECGFAFSRTAIHREIGKGADNLLPALIPDATSDVRDTAARRHGEIFAACHLPGVEPFPGAAAILKRWAAAGHILILASSASRNEVEHHIGLLDADGLLTGTISGDDAARSKPCPDIFAAALELTGGPASEALVIGDTPYDVLAARRAGVDAIALLSGGFDEVELAACRPLAICRDLAQLQELTTAPAAPA